MRTTNSEGIDAFMLKLLKNPHRHDRINLRPKSGTGIPYKF